MLPVGKLPPDLLAELLSQAPVTDPRVLLGPGVGLDCAVVDVGPMLLVFKSDPITFTAENIGWYGVQINANDIATTGAQPRWFIATLLLPEKGSNPELAEVITHEIYAACDEMGVSVIGGHTEITYGLDRPVLVGTMIGEVPREKLVTPRGANPGDRILLTKGVPIEATAVLASELQDQLAQALSEEELEMCRAFIYDPGISVLREARLAVEAGRVTAMHDPTEGGLAAALWELAEASRRTLFLDPQAVPVPSLSARVCQVLGLDPQAAIASGALLLTAAAGEARKVRLALESEGIPCAEIGEVEEGPVMVWRKTQAGRERLARPARDEIARLFED